MSIPQQECTSSHQEPKGPQSTCMSAEKLGVVLKEIREGSRLVRTTIKKIPNRVSSTDKGLSLFQVKNACFASYLTSLGHLMCAKFEGKSISNLPALNLLIQMRITLEKIKPIESKLKYRIDKLLKTLNKNSLQDGSLSHKPNLEAFQDTSSDEEGADKSDVHTQPRTARKVYRPPKLTSVKYDAMDQKLSKRFSKNLLRELKEEFSEAPEVQVDAPEILDEAFQEQQLFEEAHFTRLNISKKEKRRFSKPKAMGDELRSLLEKSH